MRRAGPQFLNGAVSAESTARVSEGEVSRGSKYPIIWYLGFRCNHGKYMIIRYLDRSGYKGCVGTALGTQRIQAVFSFIVLSAGFLLQKVCN